MDPIKGLSYDELNQLLNKWGEEDSKVLARAKFFEELNDKAMLSSPCSKQISSVEDLPEWNPNASIWKAGLQVWRNKSYAMSGLPPKMLMPKFDYSETSESFEKLRQLAKDLQVAIITGGCPTSNGEKLQTEYPLEVLFLAEEKFLELS